MFVSLSDGLSAVSTHCVVYVSSFVLTRLAVELKKLSERVTPAAGTKFSYGRRYLAHRVGAARLWSDRPTLPGIFHPPAALY